MNSVDNNFITNQQARQVDDVSVENSQELNLWLVSKTKYKPFELEVRDQNY